MRRALQYKDNSAKVRRTLMQLDIKLKTDQYFISTVNQMIKCSVTKVLVIEELSRDLAVCVSSEVRLKIIELIVLVLEPKTLLLWIHSL